MALLERRSKQNTDSYSSWLVLNSQQWHLQVYTLGNTLGEFEVIFCGHFETSGSQIFFLWSSYPIGVLTSLHPWLYPKFHPFRKNLQILVDLAPLGCTKPGVVSREGRVSVNAGPGVWPPGMIATGTCRDANLNRWIWREDVNLTNACAMSSIGYFFAAPIIRFIHT